MIKSNNPKHHLIHLIVDSTVFVQPEGGILFDDRFHHEPSGDVEKYAEPFMLAASTFRVIPQGDNREELLQQTVDNLSKMAADTDPEKVYFTHLITFSDNPELVAAAMGERPMSLIPVGDPIADRNRAWTTALPGLQPTAVEPVTQETWQTLEVAQYLFEQNRPFLFNVGLTQILRKTGLGASLQHVMLEHGRVKFIFAPRRSTTQPKA